MVSGREKALVVIKTRSTMLRGAKTVAKHAPFKLRRIAKGDRWVVIILIASRMETGNTQQCDLKIRVPDTLKH